MRAFIFFSREEFTYFFTHRLASNCWNDQKEKKTAVSSRCVHLGQDILTSGCNSPTLYSFFLVWVRFRGSLKNPVKSLETPPYTNSNIRSCPQKRVFRLQWGSSNKAVRTKRCASTRRSQTRGTAGKLRS